MPVRLHRDLLPGRGYLTRPSNTLRTREHLPCAAAPRADPRCADRGCGSAAVATSPPALPDPPSAPPPTFFAALRRRRRSAPYRVTMLEGAGAARHAARKPSTLLAARQRARSAQRGSMLLERLAVELVRDGKRVVPLPARRRCFRMLRCPSLPFAASPRSVYCAGARRRHGEPVQGPEVPHAAVRCRSGPNPKLASPPEPGPNPGARTTAARGELFCADSRGASVGCTGVARYLILMFNI